MDRRRFLRSFAACGLVPAPAMLVLPAHADPKPPPGTAEMRPGDDIYTPNSGQAGKDVVWIPTPDGLVRQMLEVAKVTKDDLVYDLGAGDGRICIAAAQLFGATAKGIEYDANLAALAQRNAERAGVGDKVEILTGDIFDPRMQERFTQATVITLYLLPELNVRLRPALLKMRPGTRIVSHAFGIGDWEPDHHFVVEGRNGLYWVVPTSVGGKWTLHADNGWNCVLDVTQRYQRIGGTMSIKGKTQQLLGAYVSGERLGFNFIADNGTMQTVTTTVQGNQLDGRIRSERTSTVVKGERR